MTSIQERFPKLFRHGERVELAPVQDLARASLATNGHAATPAHRPTWPGPIGKLLRAALLAGIGLVTVPASHSSEPSFSEEDRSWWAIQAIRDPDVPAKGPQIHPVDAFIERERAGAGLEAAPPADPQEFVRRAHFDLHGLPPTPAEVKAFASAWANDADTAVEALIDRLLSSPRYGERWAQHWLDVVRYAETDGYREDAFRPDAHRYRDYVIRSLNEDKPYDQFVREQLAADEFAADDPQTLEATGFLRLGIYEWNQRDAEGQREIMINEITNLTGEVFLGVGIGCARCHDHKFDPLLQRDYFALQAFLSSTAWPVDHKLGTPEQLSRDAAWEESTSAIREEMDAMLAEPRRHEREKHVKSFPPVVQAMYHKPAAERSSYEQQIAMLVQRQVDREEAKVVAAKWLAKDKEKLARYQVLEAQLARLEEKRPQLPTAFISTDTGRSPAVTHMGDGDKKTIVEPAYLALLGAPAPEINPTENTTGRRGALANWIASSANPLAARVMTNRIWQHHFGTGLVATPNDFGTLGEPPSHPELLDWLSSRFVEGGWHIKPLHRLIMTSQSYRQTARREPGDAESISDPGNRLLWRFPPGRLSAEQVRDAMLAVSGELRQREQGGPSEEGGEPVRSIYVKKRRNTPEEFLHCFDSPAGFDSSPERQTTTTPTQALLLANNDWPIDRARAFAKRLLDGRKEARPEDIADAYQLALGRSAKASEIQAAIDFISAQKAGIQMIKPAAPSPKFPDENGLRPATQNFASVSDQGLGSRALWLQPGSRFEQLQVDGISSEGDTFTIDAVVQLDGIHRDASVNTLVSRWNGDHTSPGWALGVTSEKSRYRPRNLIVQLTGSNPGGDTEYEVVASGLRVPTGRPVAIRATIAPGKVEFTLRRLSDPGAEIMTAAVDHNLVGQFQSVDTRLLIGGRDQTKNAHLWDGQVARLSLTSGGDTLLEALFEAGDGEHPLPGSRWLRQPRPAPPGPDPDLEALAEFCHALLSSNEFLYLH